MTQAFATRSEDIVARERCGFPLSISRIFFDASRYLRRVGCRLRSPSSLFSYTGRSHVEASRARFSRPLDAEPVVGNVKVTEPQTDCFSDSPASLRSYV